MKRVRVAGHTYLRVPSGWTVFVFHGYLYRFRGLRLLCRPWPVP